MARICDITGKRPLTGHSVSHSNRKTKRRFYPNLQVKRFYIPEEGVWIKLRVSAAGLRVIHKKGILQALKDAATNGIIVVE